MLVLELITLAISASNHTLQLTLIQAGDSQIFSGYYICKIMVVIADEVGS